MPKAIRMVVLDLDGTLLGDAGEVSHENAREIRRIHDKGVYVTIATGRIPQRFTAVTDFLGVDMCLVCANGSLVKLPGMKDNLIDELVPYVAAMEILDALHGGDKHYYAYTADGIQVTQSTATGLSKPSSSLTRVVTEDIPSYVRGNGKQIRKISVLGEEAKLDGLRDWVLSRWGEFVNCWVSGPRGIEVVNSKCSKMIAIQRVIDTLGLTLSEVMAVGDSDNDLDLVTRAGYGVAMSNGTRALKQAAMFVTGTNYEDGVAQAIRRFVS